MKTRRVVSVAVAVALTATLLQASEQPPAPGALRPVSPPGEAAVAAQQMPSQDREVEQESTSGVGDLCPGLRVRVRGAGQPMVGDVVAVDSESIDIRLARERRVVRVPRQQLTRIETLRGRKSAAGTGALVGLIPAAAFGGLLGYGFYRAFCEGCSDSPAPAMARGAVIVGAPGALLGAIVGAAVRTDRWEDIPAGRWKPRISFEPSRRGARVALSFRF
jgi:hypothetical protein